MNLPDPIVVLAEGYEGLCAAAWLSSWGRSVRVLCRGSLRETRVVEPLFAGEEGRLDPVLGPTGRSDARPALLWRDRTVAVPRRRREVAALAEVGTVRLASELWRIDRRLPHDLDGWGAGRFGQTGWTAVVRPILEAQLGGAVGNLHRGLGPLLTCRPDGPWRAPTRSGRQTTDGWVDAVRAAGGEVLDEVHVTAIEVEHGAMVGVMTEHGLERAATLVSDLAIQRTATLLPPEGEALALPTGDGDPRSLDSADLVFVELQGETELPPVVVVAGQVARIVRASAHASWISMSGPGLAEESDATCEKRALSAVAAMVASPETRAIHRVALGVPRPAPVTEGIVLRWLRRLARLGILPVGPRALYVPMLARDVVDTTVAVLDGVPPTAVRGGRLGLTPTRPWVLVQ